MQCLCPVPPLQLPAPALLLQWEGGPAYHGTSGLSMCCEFMLSVCLEGGGSGAVHRQWLQHAFNARQPQAGAWRWAPQAWLVHELERGSGTHTAACCPAGIPSAPSAAGLSNVEGLVLRVQLRFEGVRVHVQVRDPAGAHQCWPASCLA